MSAAAETRNDTTVGGTDATHGSSAARTPVASAVQPDAATNLSVPVVKPVPASVAAAGASTRSSPEPTAAKFSKPALKHVPKPDPAHQAQRTIKDKQFYNKMNPTTPPRQLSRTMSTKLWSGNQGFDIESFGQGAPLAPQLAASAPPPLPLVSPPLPFASSASRIAATRLDTARQREAALASLAEQLERRRQEDDGRLEREALEEAAQREAVLKEEEERDRARRTAQEAELARLMADRDAQAAEEAAARAERQRASSVVHAEAKAKWSASMEEELSTRRHSVEALRRRHEEGEKVRLAAVEEHAARMKAAHEERLALALTAAETRLQGVQEEMRAKAEREAGRLRTAQEARHAEALAAAAARQQAVDTQMRAKAEVDRAELQRLEREVRERGERARAEREAREAEEAGRREAAVAVQAAAFADEQQQRLAREKARVAEEEAAEAALLAARTEMSGSETRRMREKSLVGPSGCAGLLTALREVYGSEEAACTRLVFDAALAFVQVRRRAHRLACTRVPVRMRPCAPASTRPPERHPSDNASLQPPVLCLPPHTRARTSSAALPGTSRAPCYRAPPLPHDGRLRGGAPGSAGAELGCRE